MNNIQIFNNLVIIIPEIIIIVSCILALIIVSIFPKFSRLVIHLKILLLIGTLYLIKYNSKLLIGEGFFKTFFVNDYILIFKNIMIIVVIIIIFGYVSSTKIISIEYVLLILLSLVGGMIALSSRDLLLLFMGLELQSLSAYIILSFSILDSKKKISINYKK